MILNKRRVFLPAFLFMITCAYGQAVHYNYEHGANFAAYNSYEWVDIPGPGGAVSDHLIDQAIKWAVDEQLSQKGLNQVERDGYLKVGYHFLMHEEKSLDLSGFGTGIGPCGGGLGGWNSGNVTGQTSTIPVGTLVIDLYDPIRKQLVWRGDVSKVLDLNKSPDKNYRALQKAMRNLFKNYPPALHK